MKTAKNTGKTKAPRKLRNTPPLPSKRGVRLKGPKDCIRLLGRLINEVLTSSDEDRAAKEGRLRVVAYSLTNLVKCYEISELQERISKIEEYIKCQEAQQQK